MRGARNFSKDLANYMSLGIGSIGPLINGASLVSFHCFALFNTLTAGSTANRVFGILNTGSGSAGFTLGVDGSGNLLKSSNRSIAGDSTQTVGAAGRKRLALGVWNSLGAVLDYANDVVTLYVNGRVDSITSVTYGAVVYTHGVPATNSDAIGANITVPATTDAQWDGSIAQEALWAVGLGPRDMLKLSRGVPANLSLRKPVYYAKLAGVSSPEICSIGSAVVGTITGAVPVVAGPSGNKQFLRSYDIV